MDETFLSLAKVSIYYSQLAEHCNSSDIYSAYNNQSTTVYLSNSYLIDTELWDQLCKRISKLTVEENTVNNTDIDQTLMSDLGLPTNFVGAANTSSSKRRRKKKNKQKRASETNNSTSGIPIMGADDNIQEMTWDVYWQTHGPDLIWNSWLDKQPEYKKKQTARG